VAFVLDTYRPDRVDAYFDSELYAVLLESVRNVFEPDSMTVESTSGEIRDLKTAADVKRLLGSDDEAEPLEGVVLRKGASEIARIGSEPWVKSGGPMPYHDSYTIPIYSKEDRTKEIEVAARSTCAAIGAEVTEVITAQETPQPQSVLIRFKNWFWSLL
jgi:hypothetical protein